MKKIIALILTALLLLSFATACKDNDAEKDTGSEESSSTSQTDTDSESNTGNDSADNTQNNGSSDNKEDDNKEEDTKDDGNTGEDTTKGDSLKILAIGNSFSVDAMEYLWDICKDAGYKNVKLGNLYIGGCSLNTHWSNIQSGSNAYTFYQNSTGVWTSKTSSIAYALSSEDWDIVTVQQASNYSGQSSTYTNLGNIISFIEKNTSENTKILWHMTWAYQGNSTHSGFANYNNDQMTMYNAIMNVVNTTVLKDDRIDGVIPSGTAIQNLRTSYVGDTVTRDGYHLSKDIGRYTAALTWFSYITGLDTSDIKWVPLSYPYISTKLDVIKESVDNAIATPYSVSPSQHAITPNNSDKDLFESAGLNIDNYKAISLNMTVGTFYDSRNGHTPRPSTHELAPKYSATAVFSKADLPVGTVIIVDSGYQYRPEGWIDGSTLTASASRPGNVSTTFTVTDASWWKSFTLRAFNLSRTDGATMTADDSSHLRIYIPTQSS